MFVERCRSAFLCLLLIAGLSPVAAGAMQVDFTQTTLDNGLRVILVEDHSAPVIALAVTYDVGARNERPGRTGFAHLFEHLMFKGSRNVGDGEHFFQVFTNGGTMNGTTSADQTNYFQTLPANQLELVLFLEADRMRALDVTQEKIDNQRQAVQEERRLRIDNQPYGPSFERFGDLFYDNFAYSHSVIGSMEDLNAAELKDFQDFFRTYYAPNNAVLSLVGDFQPKQAMALIQKYFGDIPRQPAPPKVDLTEPAQKAERREQMEDPLARLPLLSIGYKTQPGNGPDQAALQVLSSVLQSGESSRLYQKLSKEREMVADVGGSVDERIGTGGFYISAISRPQFKPEDVEAAIYEEVERLKREPIQPWELEKARNATRLGFYQRVRGAQARAVLLGSHAVRFGDPGVLNQQLQRIDAVTPEDVQRVARQYLTQNNRTVLITVPATAAAAAK